jgi:hypothetical protein
MADFSIFKQQVSMTLSQQISLLPPPSSRWSLVRCLQTAATNYASTDRSDPLALEAQEEGHKCFSVPFLSKEELTRMVDDKK